MNKWIVRGLEVWGDGDGGYQVNDTYKIGEVNLSEGLTDEEIIRALKDEDILKESVSADVLQIDGDDSYITIDEAIDADADAASGGWKPLLTLHRE